LAPVSVRCSPPALSPFGVGFRVLARLGARPAFTSAGDPLLDLRPSSESLQASSRPRSVLAPKSSSFSVTSSREVSRPFSVSPHRAAASFDRAFHTRSPAPPGFLNLLTLLSAPCLVALFHATSAHGVAPFRAFSSRAAVRRLRRLSPLVVQANPETSPTSAASGRNLWHRPLPERPRERPRLQGFAPHESPPLTAGGLDRRRARGSPGLDALQGFPSRWLGAAFTAPPLTGFLVQARTTERPAPQGLTSSEMGLSLSRLPALLGFLAF
jgi:hypothetical protein